MLISDDVDLSIGGGSILVPALPPPSKTPAETPLLADSDPPQPFRNMWVPLGVLQAVSHSVAPVTSRPRGLRAEPAHGLPQHLLRRAVVQIAQVELPSLVMGS